MKKRNIALVFMLIMSVDSFAGDVPYNLNTDALNIPKGRVEYEPVYAELAFNRKNFSLSEAGPEAREGIDYVYTSLVARPLASSTQPFYGTDGKYHVAYELKIANISRRVDATLTGVSVIPANNAEQPIAVLDSDMLLENLSGLSTVPADNLVIEKNGARLLAINLAFDTVAEVPEKVVHRITAMGGNNPGAREPVEISYTLAPFYIDTRSVIVIDPPVKGNHWIAVNACCRVGFPHRFSVQGVNGELVNSQRFAIDFMQLNANGKLVESAVDKVNNWVSYNAPVYAVADATVVHVINNLDDQVPGALPDPRSITLYTVDGNGVVLDLGNGIFAFYAHMKKGSVRVNVGDKVKSGDLLGNLGNSGNTSAPHLHLHLMAGPSPLGDNGIPFTFSQFEYAGQVHREQYIDSEELTDDFSNGLILQAQPRQNEYPLQLNIINFPE